MRKLKIVLAMLLAILFVMPNLTVLAATPVAENGLSFSKDDRYMANKVYSKTPNSFQAWIKLPQNMTDVGGVIMGNHNGTSCVNFEIFENGHPRLLVCNGAGAIQLNAEFDQVNAATGEWVHIAIVRDTAAQKLYCYLNGALAQTLDCTYTASMLYFNNSMVVGGDKRNNNPQYFRGLIKSVALHSDARTAAEIAKDYAGLEKGDDMIAWYDFTTYDYGKRIEDKSGNNAPLLRSNEWFRYQPEPDNYAYSFAVIGDTQIVNDLYSSEFHKIYDYVLDNVESKNIKFVMGLGDITNKYGNSSNPANNEWLRAQEQIWRMDGVVPYSIVRGNHDDVSDFNKYFPRDHYEGVIGGSYGNSMANTWQTLEVGEVKYLIFGFDIGMLNEKLVNWASKIIDDHPDHNVILTTHGYLAANGDTLTADHPHSPTKYGSTMSGNDLWDALVSKHKNITMVISGHIPSDEIVVTQRKGDHGNTVTEILIDPQVVDKDRGACALVAMFYFSEDGKNLTIDYYSTARERYFLTANQFSLTVDTVDNSAPAPEPEPQPEPEPEPDFPIVIVIVSAAAVVVVGGGVAAVLIVMKKRKSAK